MSKTEAEAWKQEQTDSDHKGEGREGHDGGKNGKGQAKDHEQRTHGH